jgi:Zn-dependent protease
MHDRLPDQFEPASRDLPAPEAGSTELGLPPGSQAPPFVVEDARRTTWLVIRHWWRLIRRQLGWFVPLALFLATCASTVYAGSVEYTLVKGLIYSAAVMTILVCHEAGHYLQTRRYGVPASLPFFIPLPFTPIGTMGAVIGMSPEIPSRRALFDIGISGPLGGLVPTLIFTVVGVWLSRPVQHVHQPDTAVMVPELMRMLVQWRFGQEVLANQPIDLHPLAWAGWVGMLVTSLNLFPIGQLDGGHVLHALVPRAARHIATGLLFALIFAVTVGGYYWWFVMVFLLVLMGPEHPPTQNDLQQLGPGRTALGWATLAFLPLGFTANPFCLPYDTLWGAWQKILAS